MKPKMGDYVKSDFAGRKLKNGGKAPEFGIVKSVKRGFAYIDYGIGSLYPPTYLDDLQLIGKKNGKNLWKYEVLDESIKNKLGENKMRVTKSELKEMIREVIQEQESSDYQEFFKATCKKFGFAPEDLDKQTDEKKKKFFNYIDANWKGEKEKNETLEPVSPAAGNPLKRVKAKKRDQILASESAAERYIRKLVREELKFVNFNEIPGGLSRKRAKRRIAQKGSADTNSTV